MFLRTLHRKGIALALGSALALGLAAPVYAAAPAGATGGWVELAWRKAWEWLGAGKVAAAGQAEAAGTAGVELERSSGIDPNGRKARGSARRGAPAGSGAARPLSATFTCETMR